MQKIPLSELEKPTIAGYYALVLKATGENAKAMTFLESAFKIPILPEERKMFERAKAGG